MNQTLKDASILAEGFSAKVAGTLESVGDKIIEVGGNVTSNIAESLGYDKTAMNIKDITSEASNINWSDKYYDKDIGAKVADVIDRRLNQLKDYIDKK